MPSSQCFLCGSLLKLSFWIEQHQKAEEAEEERRKERIWRRKSRLTCKPSRSPTPEQPSGRAPPPRRRPVPSFGARSGAGARPGTGGGKGPGGTEPLTLPAPEPPRDGALEMQFPSCRLAGVHPKRLTLEQPLRKRRATRQKFVKPWICLLRFRTASLGQLIGSEEVAVPPRQSPPHLSAPSSPGERRGAGLQLRPPGAVQAAFAEGGREAGGLGGGGRRRRAPGTRPRSVPPPRHPLFGTGQTRSASASGPPPPPRTPWRNRLCPPAGLHLPPPPRAQDMSRISAALLVCSPLPPALGGINLSFGRLFSASSLAGGQRKSRAPPERQRRR